MKVKALIQALEEFPPDAEVGIFTSDDELIGDVHIDFDISVGNVRFKYTNWPKPQELEAAGNVIVLSEDSSLLHRVLQPSGECALESKNIDDIDFVAHPSPDGQIGRV